MASRRCAVPESQDRGLPPQPRVRQARVSTRAQLAAQRARGATRPGQASTLQECSSSFPKSVELPTSSTPNLDIVGGAQGAFDASLIAHRITNARSTRWTSIGEGDSNDTPPTITGEYTRTRHLPHGVRRPKTGWGSRWVIRLDMTQSAGACRGSPPRMQCVPPGFQRSRPGLRCRRARHHRGHN